MPDDRFAAVIDLYDVAAAAAAVLDDWMDEYLAAIERRNPGLEVGQTARPAAAVVRHGGIWRRGEQTPALIVWPEGVADHAYDPDGVQTGTVELGVLIVAAGQDEESTTRLAGRLSAAARALLLQRPITVTGPDGETSQHRLWPVDEDYTALDVEDRGRVRAGVTLSYQALGVPLGLLDAGPPEDADPRDDPSDPWPPPPTVATADVTIDPIDPEDP